MSDFILKSVDITNFRSIRGHVHAPLDAKVVLVHGENGAGKTSLLSSLELALTGKVQSLERADPGYQSQLLHRSMTNGNVLLKTVDGTSEHSFTALLTPTRVQSIASLDGPRASFFRERAFLPQSLLGQLLQIYQDAGNDSTSPLAQFVGKLLGLDRLDAMEAGLKPLADLRNVRKAVDGWLVTENEKSRLDRLLFDQRKTRATLDVNLGKEIGELVALCAQLELAIEVNESTLELVAAGLSQSPDSEAFALLTDQLRRLSSIRREIDTAKGSIGSNAAPSPVGPEDASKAFSRWQADHGERAGALRRRIEVLLPNIALPSDSAQFAQAALTRLDTEQRQLATQGAQARADIARDTAALSEFEVAMRQRSIIDDEISRLSSNAGSLGSLLAELSSCIDDETCPVCDRDYSEVSGTPLTEHLHRKVRMLSSSAERLLTLARSRSEAQVSLERLEREIEALNARKLDDEALAELDRRNAELERLINEINSTLAVLREGSRLREADIAARRAVSDAQARHVTLAAARATLTEFALSIGAPELAEGESFEAAASRLDALLKSQATRLEDRLEKRRRGAQHIAVVRLAMEQRKDADERIATDQASWTQADRALTRAQKVRDEGNAIRNAVDQVRSSIIRREFNDRLNRVWRDLFVRLAPGEPFVPAFRVPESSTHRLQPKLITEHRDGGNAGGTPGAMLSAGNLNTAALTLFIALHLSVPRELPWLILDDPVQSMDEVHIAQFAALLRTLSKEHGRQVMVAVHDRQLFEYLKLELSPAFPEDSLLTLELSRGPRNDSVCLSTRFSFKQESVLLLAA